LGCPEVNRERDSKNGVRKRRTNMYWGIFSVRELKGVHPSGRKENSQREVQISNEDSGAKGNLEHGIKKKTRNIGVDYSC
jgi:hypothetical protein